LKNHGVGILPTLRETIIRRSGGVSRLDHCVIESGRVAAGRPLGERRAAYPYRSPPEMARSFARSCLAWMRRTVPERERVTSDSVVAPAAPR
jgi:hypothetical protein